MRTQIWITMFLVKALMIDPVNSSFAFKDEWDCMNQILFNHEIMDILLKMEESFCQDSIKDPFMLFAQVNASSDEYDQNSPVDSEYLFDGSMIEIEDHEGQSGRSNESADDSNKYYDFKNNGIMDLLTLDFDFEIKSSDLLMTQSHMYDKANSQVDALEIVISDSREDANNSPVKDEFSRARSRELDQGLNDDCDQNQFENDPSVYKSDLRDPISQDVVSQYYGEDEVKIKNITIGISKSRGPIEDDNENNFEDESPASEEDEIINDCKGENTNELPSPENFPGRVHYETSPQRVRPQTTHIIKTTQKPINSNHVDPSELKNLEEPYSPLGEVEKIGSKNSKFMNQSATDSSARDSNSESKTNVSPINRQKLESMPNEAIETTNKPTDDIESKINREKGQDKRSEGTDTIPSPDILDHTFQGLSDNKMSENEEPQTPKTSEESVNSDEGARVEDSKLKENFEDKQKVESGVEQQTPTGQIDVSIKTNTPPTISNQKEQISLPISKTVLKDASTVPANPHQPAEVDQDDIEPDQIEVKSEPPVNSPLPIHTKNENDQAVLPENKQVDQTNTEVFTLKNEDRNQMTVSNSQQPKMVSIISQSPSGDSIATPQIIKTELKALPDSKVSDSDVIPQDPSHNEKENVLPTVNKIEKDPFGSQSTNNIHVSPESEEKEADLLNESKKTGNIQSGVDNFGPPNEEEKQKSEHSDEKIAKANADQLPSTLSNPVDIGTTNADEKKVNDHLFEKIVKPEEDSKIIGSLKLKESDIEDDGKPADPFKSVNNENDPIKSENNENPNSSETEETKVHEDLAKFLNPSQTEDEEKSPDPDLKMRPDNENDVDHTEKSNMKESTQAEDKKDPDEKENSDKDKSQASDPSHGSEPVEEKENIPQEKQGADEIHQSAKTEEKSDSSSTINSHKSILDEKKQEPVLNVDVKSKSNFDVFELQNHLYNNSIEDYDSQKFSIPPMPILKMIHYTTSNRIEGQGTLYAEQNVKNRILQAKKERTRGDVIRQIFSSFALLPRCVQQALRFCRPNEKALIKICETTKSKKSLQKCEMRDFTAVKSCLSGETFINNACYQNCPKGFFDFKLLCLKPSYQKRTTKTYRGEVLDDKNEEFWGDSLVVEKCDKFGEFMEQAGPDYCRANCPKGFLDRGLFCEKPSRFLNQPIFFFDKTNANQVMYDDFYDTS
jgi:hypothetical protein